jgi:hypothetical protein
MSDNAAELVKILIEFATLMVAVLGFLRLIYVYMEQKRRDHDLALERNKITEKSDRLNRFDVAVRMSKCVRRSPQYRFRMRCDQ